MQSIVFRGASKTRQPRRRDLNDPLSPRRPVKPIDRSDGPSGEDGDAQAKLDCLSAERFHAIFETLKAKGLSASKATNQAVKENPDLHKAFLAAFNRGKAKVIKQLTNS